MSYDLFLSTRPGQTPPSGVDWRQLLPMRDQVFNSCEITPLAVEPNVVDTIALQEGLEDGEWSIGDFTQFALANGLATSLEDAASASAFIRSRWGFDLCVIAVPRDESQVEHVFARLVSLAQEFGLRLCDPQLGKDVDLDRPGRLPGLWR